MSYLLGHAVTGVEFSHVISNSPSEINLFFVLLTILSNKGYRENKCIFLKDLALIIS